MLRATALALSRHRWSELQEVARRIKEPDEASRRQPVVRIPHYLPRAGS
ncbi:hypothetical protein [Streptomyces platensis]